MKIFICFLIYQYLSCTFSMCLTRCAYRQRAGTKGIAPSDRVPGGSCQNAAEIRQRRQPQKGHRRRVWARLMTHQYLLCTFSMYLRRCAYWCRAATKATPPSDRVPAGGCQNAAEIRQRRQGSMPSNLWCPWPGAAPEGPTRPTWGSSPTPVCIGGSRVVVEAWGGC